MNNIKWEDGAVCFAGGKQYTNVFIPSAVMAKDFQLNEIRQGDYIEASEIDTEQKYNDAVEVFWLFGFSFSKNATSSFYEFKNNVGGMVDHNLNFLSCCDDGLFHTDKTLCKRQLTYPQLMAIGELKRAMIERDSELEYSNRVIDSGCYDLNSKRNKSKQAYEILKSLDYDYDLDKQQWFKKHYI